MEKKIITIGYEIPGGILESSAFSSNQSILDADIVVFEPDFDDYNLEHSYRGKPLYVRDVALKLQEDSQYWEKELDTALRAGKTVFVFFKEFKKVYIQVTDEYYRTSKYDYDNYRFFPVPLPTIEPRKGNEVVFVPHPAFSSLWDIFGEHFKYESYLDDTVKNPLFVTRTAEKVVGALFKVGDGNLVLLPVLEYDKDEFIDYDPNDGSKFWTRAATEFGYKLVKAFVDIDKALRNDDTRTPPPEWTNDENFQLTREQTMKKEVERKSEEISKLTSEKSELLEAVHKESRLRDLLFEKGKALENVVIDALEILGYKAENYDDGILELDQVITSPDGDRFIGETRG